MLNLFDDDILAIDQHKDITSTKMYRIGPSLYRRIERMGGSGDDLFTVYKHMDQLVGLVDIGFDDFFRRDRACFLVPGPDHVSSLDRLYGYCARYCQNQCACDEAVRGIDSTVYSTGDRSLQESCCSSVCSGLCGTIPTASCQSVCYSSRYGSCYCTGCTLGYCSDQCTVGCAVYSSNERACGGTAGGDSNSSRCGDDRHTDANLCPVGKCKGTAIVGVIDRVVQAVGKQIVARKSGACTDIRGGICIDETTDARVIITALQVVEPGFSGGAVAVLVFTGIL